MTRRLLVAAALMLTVAGLGTLPVLAQSPAPQAPGQRMGGPGRGRGPGGAGPGLMPLLQQLDLTDQQREQVRQLMQESRPAPGSMQPIRDAELSLHAAIFGDAPNPQGIDTSKAALNAAHAAELDQQIELMAKIAQILTPDQRQQLLKLEAQGPPAGRGRGF